MAVDISKLNLNDQKRAGLAQSVNLKGELNSTEFAQFAETYVANVIPEDCILAETYLVVETPMPTGALATVEVNGVQVFDAVAVDVAGAQRSSVGLGINLGSADAVSIVISGGTGDITTGDISVVTRTIEWKQVNGKYTTTVPMTPYDQ